MMASARHAGTRYDKLLEDLWKEKGEIGGGLGRDLADELAIIFGKGELLATAGPRWGVGMNEQVKAVLMVFSVS